MTFTKELWAAMEPIYAAILEHAFVRGLTDGSLSREAFRFYAVQDALYLRELVQHPGRRKGIAIVGVDQGKAIG